MPLLRGGGKKHLGRGATSVGHTNVNAAELLRHMLHERFDGIRIGHIQRFSEHLGAIAFADQVLLPDSVFVASREHIATFAPSAANFSAAVARDAIARRGDNDIAVLESRSNGLPLGYLVAFLAQVGIFFVEPILPGGVKMSTSIVSSSAMASCGIWGGMQGTSPAADGDFPVVDVEVQCAFEDVGDLLIVMAVQRHPGALLKQDARDHDVGPDDHLAADRRA